MRETIVVTGGAGYIGSHIGYLLAQKGYHVILLDNLLYHQSTAPFSWATVQVNDYGDATVLDALFKEHKVKAIVHCAAYIEVGRSVKEPHDFYENKPHSLQCRQRVRLNVIGLSMQKGKHCSAQISRRLAKYEHETRIACVKSNPMLHGGGWFRSPLRLSTEYFFALAHSSHSRMHTGESRLKICAEVLVI